MLTPVAANAGAAHAAAAIAAKVHRIVIIETRLAQCFTQPACHMAQPRDSSEMGWLT